MLAESKDSLVRYLCQTPDHIANMAFSEFIVADIKTLHIRLLQSLKYVSYLTLPGVGFHFEGHEDVSSVSRDIVSINKFCHCAWMDDRV